MPDLVPQSAAQIAPDPHEGRAVLQAWYRSRARRYPWRLTTDPYRILVSEFMLQQTQAARVVPAYQDFLARFPSVRSLAVAPLSDVLRAWGGLGYNLRPRNLLSSARVIVADHAGEVPRDPRALEALAGVGPYTAAAVASIAFGVPTPAVDTNVGRVVARARFGIDADEAGLPAVAGEAARWLDRRSPGAWNQALMDVGRDHCRPTPRCVGCPLRARCRFRLRQHSARSPSTATPSKSAPFAGSRRELRGRIVRELRDNGQRSLAALARVAGRPLAEVAEAVLSLVEDRLVVGGRAAMAGDPRGRIRLAG